MPHSAQISTALIAICKRSSNVLVIPRSPHLWQTSTIHTAWPRARRHSLRSLSGQRHVPMAAGGEAGTLLSDDAGPGPASLEQAVLVQYVVLRADLWKVLGWPLGSIIAQACHAATAALWLSRQEAASQAYCADGNLDRMHKVVLEVKGEAQLTNLAAQLEEAGVRHKLWVEQPENFPTCLATAPHLKDDVQQHFKKLKLCKG